MGDSAVEQSAPVASESVANARPTTQRAPERQTCNFSAEKCISFASKSLRTRPSSQRLRTPNLGRWPPASQILVENAIRPRAGHLVLPALHQRFSEGPAILPTILGGHGQPTL